ncbi:hypothetical protein [Acidovorax sp. K2F]|uniref:hypothetical protein n=1 Tax=Acidovorax sp. K2F TaxID=2978125 RepID=UPI0021B1168C|nr:hypothetical protein [Acidovorax sp. K2F]MCT6721599.1 hypothetical protein [Acidovorax sp. K2F]
MSSKEARLSALSSLLEASSTPPSKQATRTQSEIKEVAKDTIHNMIEAVPIEPGFDAARDVRISVLRELRWHRSVQRDFGREKKALPQGQAVDRVFAMQITRNSDTVMEYEDQLKRDFIPQHSASQFISSQQLIMSRLFNVRGPAERRAEYEMFTVSELADGSLRFRGPELRQQDGLVFMSLLNMLRDFKAQTLVSFRPADFCVAALGSSYSGQARERLRQSILRLQSSVLEFPKFSVQLAQRFDYPNEGPWRVALDKNIVALFRNSREVWLDATLARKIPHGVCSWLYAYVEAQHRLIPTSAEYLRKLSGSLATPDSYERSLRQALGQLASAQILDPGWSVKNGKVHWRKRTQTP